MQLKPSRSSNVRATYRPSYAERRPARAAAVSNYSALPLVPTVWSTDFVQRVRLTPSRIHE